MFFLRSGKGQLLSQWYSLHGTRTMFVDQNRKILVVGQALLRSPPPTLSLLLVGPKSSSSRYYSTRPYIWHTTPSTTRTTTITTTNKNRRASTSSSRKSNMRSMTLPMQSNHSFFFQIPTHLEIRRCFESESSYHTVADQTLEEIQDAVEMALEEYHSPAFVDGYEVVFASGVLTMTLPPHGTWVLNKQTPNRQIWWSSPLSGPRRYEYEDGEWVFTRDDSHSMTLKQAMAEEFQTIYGIELDIE